MTVPSSFQNAGSTQDVLRVLEIWQGGQYLILPEYKRITCLKILVLIKAPWTHLGLLPNGIMLVKIEWCGSVEEARKHEQKKCTMT